MRSHLVWQLLVFAAFSIQVGTRALAGPVDAEAVNRVRAPFQERIKQQNPIWIKYRLKFTETPAWQESSYRKRIKDGPLTWECDAEYARKGAKFRSSASLQGHPVARFTEPIVIYNGEVRVVRGWSQDEYTISSSSEIRYAVEPPFDLCGDDEWNIIFDRFEKDRKGFAAASVKSSTDGSTEIELTATNRWRSRAVFLRDGYVIAKRESFTARGTLQHKTEMTYAEHQGIRYPAKGIHVHYFGNGSEAYKVEYEATSIETDASKIPDSLFTLRIPKDGLVADEDRKMLLRNTDLAGSSIAGAVERLERPHGRRWLWWVVAPTALVGLIAGLFVFNHRRRTGRNS